MPRTETLLSVIVPSLNEQAKIGPVIDRILCGAGLRNVEVIVADGGSADRTKAIAHRRGAVVISCPRGRAAQMNCGSEWANGDVLLYCHADTFLPIGYGRAIMHSLHDPGVLGGAFSPVYDSSHWLMRVAEKLLTLPTQWLMFGDQGIFARRSALEAVNFYPPVPLMEDVALVHRIHEIGRLVRLPDPVRTSARRFHERGVARQLWLDLRLLTAFHLGASGEHLADRYHNTVRDLTP